MLNAIVLGTEAAPGTGSAQGSQKHGEHSVDVAGGVGRTLTILDCSLSMCVLEHNESALRRRLPSPITVSCDSQKEFISKAAVGVHECSL